MTLETVFEEIVHQSCNYPNYPINCFNNYTHLSLIVLLLLNNHTASNYPLLLLSIHLAHRSNHPNYPSDVISYPCSTSSI